MTMYELITFKLIEEAIYYVIWKKLFSGNYTGAIYIFSDKILLL